MQETIKPLKLTVANGKEAWSSGSKPAQVGLQAKPVACKWLQFDVVTCPITTSACFSSLISTCAQAQDKIYR